MEAPKRGSNEWVQEKTNIVVAEAVLHISDVLDAMLASNESTGTAKISIDTRHCQIDEHETVRLIKEFIEREYELTAGMYVLDYTYERDYEINRDFFKVEIVLR